MLDPTAYQAKFDFRSFGDQFFVRDTDAPETENMLKNDKYKTEIEKLREYYSEFVSKVPDIGKREIVEKASKVK
jgi:hypothetical protein